MSTPGAWLRDEHSSAARDKLLDIAEDLFFRRGVADVTMRQIADAAGCSRATLYRYFPGRDELDLAYVDRATRVIASEIDAATVDIVDPADRLVAAVTTALDGVRANPALLQWFSPRSAGSTGRLAMSSEVIDAVATRFVALVGPSVDADGGRWIVRIIISLLSVPPEMSGTPEDQLIRRFVVPVIVPSHRTKT